MTQIYDRTMQSFILNMKMLLIPDIDTVPNSYETVNNKFVWNSIKQILYTDALGT